MPSSLHYLGCFSFDKVKVALLAKGEGIGGRLVREHAFDSVGIAGCRNLRNGSQSCCLGDLLGAGTWRVNALLNTLFEFSIKWIIRLIIRFVARHTNLRSGCPRDYKTYR